MLVHGSHPVAVVYPSYGPQYPKMMSRKSVVTALFVHILVSSALLLAAKLPARVAALFTSPAHVGEAALVPPTIIQPASAKASSSTLSAKPKLS
jgi:hypothetical protein